MTCTREHGPDKDNIIRQCTDGSQLRGSVQVPLNVSRSILASLVDHVERDYRNLEANYERFRSRDVIPGNLEGRYEYVQAYQGYLEATILSAVPRGKLWYSYVYTNLTSAPHIYVVIVW